MPNVRTDSLLKGSASTLRSKQAHNLLDVLLKEPKEGTPKTDAISGFYSAIAKERKKRPERSGSGSASTQHRNLAINQNTADRHGRT